MSSSLENLKEETEEETGECETEEEESEEEALRTEDKNARFFATFIDGSSFRYLIEYLRLTSLDGTFVFTKDYITYQKQDDDKTIFNDVTIRTYELTNYHFSSTNSEIVATVNLSDLRNKTRTVGKKDQLDIFRNEDEPSNFYIQVRSQEKSSGDNAVFYCMSMKSQNINIYKLEEYSRGKTNPNCTVYQPDFSKLCKALVANKCGYAEFIGYKKGIVIKGYSSENKIIMIKEYGKCDMSANNNNSFNATDANKSAPKLNIRDVHEIERFKIPIDNIKALSKINGFGANSTLKIYIEPNAPLKIVTPIGSYGELKILLKSC